MKLKEQLLTAIIQSVRVPKKLHSFDLTQEFTAVRFSYGDKRFRVTTRGFVEEVHGGFLSSGTHTTSRLQVKIQKALA